MAQANVFTLEPEKLTQAPDIQGKQLMESPDLEKVAKQVIEEKSINIGPASVSYMLVYPNISKQTAAKCMKATKETKFYSGHDFIIQVSGEMYDMLDDETIYTLMWHELLHIDAQFKAKTQEWKYSIRPHDYSDFYEIVDRVGVEWYKTIQATVSSLYDLDPKQESRVSV